MELYKLPPSWQKLSDDQRRSIMMKLLDQLDLSQKALRMKAARCILYLAQGCFAEVQSDHEQHQWTRANVKMLYELGLFTAFVELLNYEIEYVSCVVELQAETEFVLSISGIQAQQILQCAK